MRFIFYFETISSTNLVAVAVDFFSPTDVQLDINYHAHVSWLEAVPCPGPSSCLATGTGTGTAPSTRLPRPSVGL